MRTVKESNKKAVEAELAQLINGQPNEVGITRNTTESMDIIIGGYPWQAGDEAIMATEDYGSMVQMFKQVAKRYGVVNKVVSVPRHPKSDEEIVKEYEDAITPKTKLLMVCHIINVTGHILPIRKICDMAHSKGVDVMVDGAHAVGHFPVDVKALNCDYYGSSLHKWLSAPIGSGLLYVKQDKIKKIFPRFAGYSEGNPEDISYLNHTGTNPVHINLGILDAIEYLTRLGLERKTARLRYLQHLWTDAVRDLPNIEIHTPKDMERSCAIASVIVKGMNPKEMAKHLLEKYRIWTVGFTVGNINGCRITPNIYTTKKEIEVFVKALKEMATKG
jgi:selenocysteine lyase/cysteine desulfurase